METALPFKKFLTEECFAQISNITNIAKESICEQYSKYYNHLQEEDKHAHSVVLVVNHHTVGPQGHQQIMVCALEREEEQRENVNISTICGINVVSLCQPVPPQNKCILIGTFFGHLFGHFLGRLLFGGTCSSSKRMPGEGDRLSVVPSRSFSTFAQLRIGNQVL